MYNGKKCVVVFHLMTIEGCEDIIDSYLRDIMESGLYDDCDKFLLRIRYMDAETNDRVIRKLLPYKKFQIVNVVENDHNFSSYIRRHFIKDLSYKVEGGLDIRTGYRLGEIESIMDCVIDPSMKKLLADYEVGFFLSSKSMSHISGINITDRTEDTDAQNVKNQFRCIYGYRSMMCKTLDPNIDKRFHSASNKFFSFRVKWLLDFDIDNYFESIMDHDLKFGESMLGGGIYKVKGEFKFRNRHAFANFGDRMNLLQSHGYLELNYDR